MTDFSSSRHSGGFLRGISRVQTIGKTKGGKPIGRPVVAAKTLDAARAALAASIRIHPHRSRGNGIVFRQSGADPQGVACRVTGAELEAGWFRCYM